MDLRINGEPLWILFSDHASVMDLIPIMEKIISC